MALSDNAKFGIGALTVGVLGYIIEQDNSKKALASASVDKRLEFTRVAASAGAVGHVAMFASLIALYRSGWKKTAMVGLGVGIGGMVLGAGFGVRIRGADIFRTGQGIAERAVTGYIPPYMPSVSPSYPWPWAAYPEPVW